MCVASGATCVYPAPKLRHSKVAEAQPEPQPEAQPEAPEPAIPENEEPDDLPSPGFHTEPVAQAVHEPLNEHVQHHEGHVHETVLETPSAAFEPSHNIYQHSGLSFPQVNTAATTEYNQLGVSSTAMDSTPTDYVSNTVSDNFAYHQHPPSAPKVTSVYADQTAPAAQYTHSTSTGIQPSTTRRGLPTNQPSHSNGMNTAATDTQNTWQSMSSTTAPTATPTRTSPRMSRAKKPAPAQAYDDMRQQQPSTWATANQSISQPAQPVRNSPSQTAAQPARAKSRQSNRAQTRTPVNNSSVTRATQPQTTQSYSSLSGYASTGVTQQPTSAQSYNNYTSYHSGNTRADSTSDRVSYQPHSNN